MKPIKIGISFIKIYSNKKRSFANYKCPYCENIFESLCSTVNTGDKKSCGCATNFLKSHITHNLSKHPLYRIWMSMRQRCNNRKSTSYKNYGGRGISVCQEWENEFIHFYDWSIKNGYQKGLSIDRIDNNGNYEPSNCRWENTRSQNCNKRFIAGDSGYIGVSINKNRYLASVSIEDKKKHIGTFKTALEASLSRDLYIIDNKLPNKRNFNLKDI